MSFHCMHDASTSVKPRPSLHHNICSCPLKKEGHMEKSFKISFGCFPRSWPWCTKLRIRKEKKISGKLRKNKIKFVWGWVALRPLKKNPTTKSAQNFRTRRNCAEYSGQFSNESYPQTFTCKAHSFQTQLLPWLCRVFTADVIFHTTASHLSFLISYLPFSSKNNYH